MLCSNEINTTNNIDIYDTYKDLHLTDKNVKRRCFKVYNNTVV